MSFSINDQKTTPPNIHEAETAPRRVIDLGTIPRFFRSRTRPVREVSRETHPAIHYDVPASFEQKEKGISSKTIIIVGGIVITVGIIAWQLIGDEVLAMLQNSSSSPEHMPFHQSPLESLEMLARIGGQNARELFQTTAANNEPTASGTLITSTGAALSLNQFEIPTTDTLLTFTDIDTEII